MIKTTICDSVFNSMVVEVCLSYESENAHELIIHKCLFSNITGRALFVNEVDSKVYLTSSCFYQGVQADNYKRISANKFEDNITSTTCISATIYISMYYNNMLLKSVNHSSCTISDEFMLMLQSPQTVSTKELNFNNNNGTNIFGMSFPLSQKLVYEVQRCNVIETICKPGSHRQLFHVNLPNGSLTLKQWVIFRNTVNVILAISGKIILTECWSDNLVFSTGSQNGGVIFEDHNTFWIERWYGAGCRGEPWRVICSERCRAKVRTVLPQAMFLLSPLSSLRPSSSGKMLKVSKYLK